MTALRDHRSPGLRLHLLFLSLSELLPLFSPSVASHSPPNSQNPATTRGKIMCGIFFSLSQAGSVSPNEETCCLLRNRGPDSFQAHSLQHDARADQADARVSLCLTFVSTVLSMRGDHLVSQPLVDAATQSVLCWNGDAWKIAGQPIQGNDTEVIFNLLLQATKSSSEASVLNDSVQNVANVISSISGPFAFVFYDAVNSRLFFSRDCLGRRSLLQGCDEQGSLKICSLCDGTTTTHFEEVLTDGMHMIDLDQSVLWDVSQASTGANVIFNPGSIQTIPWTDSDSDPGHNLVNCSIMSGCT